MRDRLIESIDDFIYTVDVNKWYSEELDEQLADYLLADGWMRPPCKVGTTVYCIIDGFDTVAEGRVRFYTVHKDCIIYEVAINGYYAQRYTNKDFGYKIFFEREEAEKAMKGGGEG